MSKSLKDARIAAAQLVDLLTKISDNERCYVSLYVGLDKQAFRDAMKGQSALVDQHDGSALVKLTNTGDVSLTVGCGKYEARPAPPVRTTVVVQ